MADEAQRYKLRGCTGDNGSCYAEMVIHHDGDYMLHSACTKLETELQTVLQREAAPQVRHDNKLDQIAALHAEIIEQGRLVQIAASGESKYGAMSAGEYIKWALGKLGGK